MRKKKKGNYQSQAIICCAVICCTALFKCQCCPHIETSQLIYTARQLTGFYMRATLTLNGLIKLIDKSKNHPPFLYLKYKMQCFYMLF